MHHVGDAPRPPAAGPSRIYTDFLLLQLAALVFLCDQFTKFLARTFLPFRDSFPDYGFFRFTHAQNTGSAFGLFQGNNFPLILVAIFGIAVLVLVYYTQRRRTTLLRTSLGLQIGGALGNLIDRIRLGHVTDFLDVGAWPVFNIADSSIVIGLVLLGWIFVGPGSRTGQRQPEASITAAPAGLSDSPQAPVTRCPVCGGGLHTVAEGRRCMSCGVRLLPQAHGVVEAAQPLDQEGQE